jgi:hypothetical protein
MLPPQSTSIEMDDWSEVVRNLMIVLYYFIKIALLKPPRRKRKPRSRK